jgi:hypothetical protein
MPQLRNFLARRRPLRVAALCLALASAALYPTAAGGELRAGIERGHGLGAFDEKSVANGSLTPSTRFAYRGQRSAHSVYNGQGANGYARGIFDVDWQQGDAVRYSAAFRLPAGFYRSMQGQVALMRWDNWPTHGGQGDVGGIVIYGSDRTARLVRGRYGGEQVPIGKGFRLPIGRWFRLGVQQRFSQSHPRSVVHLNGRRVVSSRARNSEGRRIDRIRYGLVAIAAGIQRKRLDLYFDEARATG